VDGWLVHIYSQTQRALADQGHEAPDFDGFMAAGNITLPRRKEPGAMVKFHADPAAAPLNTPSGRIELFSQAVADTGQLGHAAWIEPVEWLGGALAKAHGFQLIANQPATRLHSQLDFGATSMAAKIDGREVARLNHRDAAERGIKKGDVIRLFNDRGALLAAALPSSDIAPNVVQISTGAWYAPQLLPGAGLTCVNGNPNAVTSDRGASALSQGCAGQLCLVSLEKWTGVVPKTWPHAAPMQPS
jgi:biotin/methionine sulfoxide reductase